MQKRSKSPFFVFGARCVGSSSPASVHGGTMIVYVTSMEPWERTKEIQVTVFFTSRSVDRAPERQPWQSVIN